ncbi:MAG: hypothetical protein ABII18_01870 [bacterium]|nr:hypothetical protein [bacterium]
MGFQLKEIMTGTHSFEKGFGSGHNLFMEFVINWGPKNMLTWLNPTHKDFLLQPLKGHVTVAGLCQQAPCTGTLELRYFNDYKIRYTFTFKVKGKTYSYVGEKVNIKPWNLPISHTTCFGRITEKNTGKLVSTSVVYFRLRTMLQFFFSFRLK